MLSWYRFHFKSGGAKSFQKFRHQKLFQCSFCKSLFAGKNVILRTFPNFRSTQRRACGLSRRLRKLSATAAQSCIVLWSCSTWIGCSRFRRSLLWGSLGSPRSIQLLGRLLCGGLPSWADSGPRVCQNFTPPTTPDIQNVITYTPLSQCLPQSLPPAKPFAKTNVRLRVTMVRSRAPSCVSS